MSGCACNPVLLLFRDSVHSRAHSWWNRLPARRLLESGWKPIPLCWVAATGRVVLTPSRRRRSSQTNAACKRRTRRRRHGEPIPSAGACGLSAKRSCAQRNMSSSTAPWRFALAYWTGTDTLIVNRSAGARIHRERRARRPAMSATDASRKSPRSIGLAQEGVKRGKCVCGCVVCRRVCAARPGRQWAFRG